MNVKELQEMLGKWGGVFYGGNDIVIRLSQDIDETPEEILIKIEDQNFRWVDGEYILYLDDDED